MGGLMDPASSIGLEKHDEDFGQTLAVWGIEKGPYIMLPLLGPSTLRDSVAYPANSYLDPLNQIRHIPTRNQTKVVELVDKRAGLIAIEGQLESATDEYAFVRDVYLQNRKYKVYDGDIPLDDDFGCEEEDEEDCEF
ncbi:MAG: MlaA family lipoprotein [Enterobacterales bacterium]|nr:MlaA family lipoprotein [Enterobacterales bacterium]